MTGKKLRASALAVAVLFVLVMLLSALHIALEADHDCTGSGCAECRRIEACVAVFRVAAPIAALFAAAALRRCFTGGYTVRECRAACATLVALKVKLSD